MTKKELDQIAVQKRKQERLEKTARQKEIAAEKRAATLATRSANAEIAATERARIAADKQERLDRRRRKITNLYTSTIRGSLDTLREQDFVCTDEQLSDWGRQLGNSIYDFGSVWTGLMSVSLRDAILHSKSTGEDIPKNDKPCCEHFLPRQFAGESIIKMVCDNRGMSLDFFIEVVEDFRWVHKVTKYENNKLIEFQNSSTFIDWQTSYRQAGIEMVRIKCGGKVPWLMMSN